MSTAYAILESSPAGAPADGDLPAVAGKRCGCSECGSLPLRCANVNAGVAICAACPRLPLIETPDLVSGKAGAKACLDSCPSVEYSRRLCRRLRLPNCWALRCLTPPGAAADGCAKWRWSRRKTAPAWRCSSSRPARAIACCLLPPSPRSTAAFAPTCLRPTGLQARWLGGNAVCWSAICSTSRSSTSSAGK